MNDQIIHDSLHAPPTCRRSPAPLRDTGGVLFDDSLPYGDLFMEVNAPFRRRGFGILLVKELKRVCHEQGRIPAPRYAVANVASRATIPEGP